MVDGLEINLPPDQQPLAKIIVKEGSAQELALVALHLICSDRDTHKNKINNKNRNIISIIKRKKSRTMSAPGLLSLCDFSPSALIVHSDCLPLSMSLCLVSRCPLVVAQVVLPLLCRRASYRSPRSFPPCVSYSSEARDGTLMGCRGWGYCKA